MERLREKTHRFGNLSDLAILKAITETTGDLRSPLSMKAVEMATTEILADPPPEIQKVVKTWVGWHRRSRF